MSGLAKDAIGWGVLLWLIGYLLGIALFFFVPVGLIGWLIIPIGTSLTVWVVLTRIRASGVDRAVIVASAWTLIAIAGDYVFIVRALAPADGYYKFDVYLYYALTFAIPLIGIMARPAAGAQASAGSPAG